MFKWNWCSIFVNRPDGGAVAATHNTTSRCVYGERVCECCARPETYIVYRILADDVHVVQWSTIINRRKVINWVVRMSCGIWKLTRSFSKRFPFHSIHILWTFGCWTEMSQFVHCCQRFRLHPHSIRAKQWTIVVIYSWNGSLISIFLSVFFRHSPIRLLDTNRR